MTSPIVGNSPASHRPYPVSGDYGVGKPQEEPAAPARDQDSLKPAPLKTDRVSLSPEGRAASKALLNPEAEEPENGARALASDEEKQAGQDEQKAGEAPQGEGAGEGEGAKPGQAGQPGGGQDDPMVAGLKQRLEVLSKQAEEVGREIDKLKADPDDPESREALKEKEQEKQMLSAQIEMMSRQLSKLEQENGEN